MRNDHGEKPVWIGLAHVAPSATCEVLAPGKNAFANVVGRASTALEFESEVKAACRRLDLELQALKEVAFYDDRFDGTIIPEEIEVARAEISDGQPIAFARFFTYKLD
jgi:hypothetical protein